MNTKLQTQVKATSSPSPSITPTRTDVLQRRSKDSVGSVIVPRSAQEALPWPGQSRFEHDFSQVCARPPARVPIQAKLAISQPGDKYEREADRMAEAVLRKPAEGAFDAVQVPSLQRNMHSTETTVAEAEFARQIETLRENGKPLPPSTRTFFEPRFGRDFSDVRVHTGYAADRVARSVNARAFTVGQDVVFRSGDYDPISDQGKRLLAHELTHVIQQNGAAAGLSPSTTTSDQEGISGRDANTVAETVDATTMTTGRASFRIARPAATDRDRLRVTALDGGRSLDEKVETDMISDTAQWPDLSPALEYQLIDTMLVIQRTCELGTDDRDRETRTRGEPPILRRGDRGTAVRRLQRLLDAAGIDIGEQGVDGIYGTDTESAVKVFQRQQGLEDDGIAGDNTWAALHEVVGMIFTPEEAAEAMAAGSEETQTMTFTVEEAQAPPPLPGDFCAPLRPTGKGAYYSGGGSEDYMQTQLEAFAEEMREKNYPALAQGAELFLAMAPLEGWMSAINTYDNKVLTWGSGFAYNGSLNQVWAELDNSVKQFLAQHAPDYFAGGDLTVAEDIRKDANALSALVYVAEHDPYRAHVLRAMFRAFLEDTLNIAEAPETGERLPGGSLDRAREFAIRLQHWLPAFMEIPDDLAAVAEEYESEAESQDEDQQPSAAEVKAAAELMVRFARRFLDSDRFGEDRTQGGRIQTAVGYRATVKFQRGLKRFFGSFEIPGQATDVFPGFTSGSEPYFEFHDSETDINEGSDVLVHYVKGKDNRYVDLGRR